MSIPSEGFLPLIRRTSLAADDRGKRPAHASFGSGAAVTGVTRNILASSAGTMKIKAVS